MAKSRNIMDGSFNYGLTIIVGACVLTEELVRLFCIAVRKSVESGKQKAGRK